MPCDAALRRDRLAASAVLATLFVGIGALGWLLGHVLTYDATGQGHHHGSHAYMEPLGQGSIAIAIVGILLAVVAVAIGRKAVGRWVARWDRSGSRRPWAAAATVPASAFTLVEFAEGSIAARGYDLLALGVPLQVAIGLVVLSLVRSLLGVLVRVADRIAGIRARVRRGGDARIVRAGGDVPSMRIAPMATNAALRAPPRHEP